ncbi:MAG: type IV pilus assembly protein PilM [Candidatus Omnitrophota bacterium]|nr:MAG: type IV pilus assembly protein PilM [Candidatus Omnitrophota bacterium]
MIKAAKIKEVVMQRLFRKKEQLNVGVDIGATFIKAVAIDKSKTPPELTAFSYEPLTKDTTASVKKAITKLGISNISVNTSISGPSVIVRIVEMPGMSERELKSAVKFEAERYIPYKLDEVITDFVKLEELTGGKISVLLVAAKKSVINNRIELLSGAGLTLRAIDIDSFAIMNAFLNSQKESKDITCALIDIGAKITNINIVSGEQSYLTRDIQIAGDDITVAIAEKLNLKKNKAETLKVNPVEQKNERAPIIKDAFYNLLNEIRLSFDFYENRYGKNVQKIYVSGGSSRLEGISDFIKDILSGDIVFWDPFNNINMSPKIDTAALEPIKASFAVAVGLGLRES